jgi:high-affinity iron transporter
MDFSAALPTFVVTLREGFEAALVVGIVLAFLQKAQQTSLYRWVYLGIGGGILASTLVGLFLGGLLQGLESTQGMYTPVVKEFLAGIFTLVAIAMLSWMLIWMTLQAKSVKSEVQGSISNALAENNNARRAIFLLIFMAVLREGFETVLFIIAKFQEGWQLPAIGAISGLTTAAALGFLLFRWGVKINIRQFFQIMGIFLLLIVGGLVVSALKDFDAAIAMLSQLDLGYSNLCFDSGASCILGPQVWDASQVLPDKEFPGIILKSLFGYRQTLYLAQAIAYVGFLVIVGGIYFQSLTGRSLLGNKNKASAS